MAERDVADPGGRIATCQFEPAIGDRSANVDTMRDLATAAAADVVVFPELTVSGYDLEVARENPSPVPGTWSDALVGVAADADALVVAGLPERDGPAVYNSLVAADGDGVRGVYRKPCLWGDEASVFTAGDSPTIVESPLGDLGLAICYDLNFPELFTAYSRRGVDVVAVASAWRESYTADWRLLLRARALDGPVYVAGSNHVGDQRGREHAGRSLVTDPTGDVIAEADAAGADSVAATVSPEVLSRSRERNPVRQTRAEEAVPDWTVE